jgi:hypothetical protein
MWRRREQQGAALRREAVDAGRKQALQAQRHGARNRGGSYSRPPSLIISAPRSLRWLTSSSHYSKFMLGFITGNKPRDEIEATLLAQIGACQVATMRMANRLAHAETLQAQDSAERAFNKLARTSAALVETFQRHRAASEHKVIVQHVSVNDGGQAIVGHVTPRARRMELKKRGRVTPALADARRTAIELADQPQRTSVPLQRRLKDDN